MWKSASRPPCKDLQVSPHSDVPTMFHGSGEWNGEWSLALKSLVGGGGQTFHSCGVHQTLGTFLGDDI